MVRKNTVYARYTDRERRANKLGYKNSTNKTLSKNAHANV